MLDQPADHGGHQEQLVHAVLLDAVQDGQLVECRHDDLGHQALGHEQGQAAAGHMEHGRDHHAHLHMLARHVAGIGQGVDEQVVVAEHHPLGPARGAARIHHGSQVVAAAQRVGAGRGSGQQLLVVQSAFGRGARAAEHHDAQAGGQLAQPGHQGREGIVHEEHARVAVVQRVGHLVRAPADVDGVDRGACPPAAIEVFKVADGVQAHHADAVAGRHVQRPQQAGTAFDALRKLRPAGLLCAADGRRGAGLFAAALVDGLGEIHGHGVSSGAGVPGGQRVLQARGARGAGLLGHAARKTRRRRGLEHATGLGERGARAVVGMLGRLVPVEHGGEAGIAAFQQLAPLLARARAEHVGQAQLEQGPACGVQLRVEQRVLYAAALAQLGVELRLDGAYGDVFAVGAGIGVIEVRAAVQQVLSALVAPLALGLEAVHEGRQQGRAIGHGRIDDLAPAAAPGLVQGGQQAHGQQHAAAAEVAHIVERRHGRLARAADGVQGAGDGDVVDVMPRRMRQRPVLAPARHAAVDQARVARQAGLGAQAQALHHAGPKALDQQIGACDQRQGRGLAFLAAQVDLDLAAAARGDVLRIDRRAGPRDAQHLGTHVGQQHGAERPRAQARELDNAHAFKRSWHGGLLSGRGQWMVLVLLAQLGL